MTTTTSTSSPPRPHDQLHDVVIAGGGIAGLSTALALHRLGVQSVILEQSQHPRVTGAGIIIWSNAWKVLETLGVAESLRPKFTRISRFELWALNGGKLASFDLQSETRDVELRAVERRVLLEALREALPADMMFYDAHVSNIRQLTSDKLGYTEVECSNGWRIRTKVLIGCDGIGSVVAKWMGMKRPRYAGYRATRGLAEYPEGHNLVQTGRQIIGNGVRVGMMPMDTKRVFWFLVCNEASAAGGGGDEKEKKMRGDAKSMIREEALRKVEGWPEMVVETIRRTEREQIHVGEVSDRWMWPPWLMMMRWGSWMHRGGVTLTGDAMHPITPNLGQGGCCALEDALVLARELGKAMISMNMVVGNPNSKKINTTEFDSEVLEKIDGAIKAYVGERWRRMLVMGVKSYAVGALLQMSHPWAISLRNALLFPYLLTLDTFTAHTYYDCGPLE